MLSVLTNSISWRVF